MVTDEAAGAETTRASLLTLASSPGLDRIHVLQNTLSSITRLKRWVDLGAVKGRATGQHPSTRSESHTWRLTSFNRFHRRRIFVCAEIPAFVESTVLGPDCAVSMLDVIEHFPRGDAIALLETLERKAGAVVIFTPDGFYPQDATTDQAFVDNPISGIAAAGRRKSSWSVGTRSCGFLLFTWASAACRRSREPVALGGLPALARRIELLRMRPFVNPATFAGAWKEHVRSRHGDSRWYVLAKQWEAAALTRSSTPASDDRQ